MTLDVKIPRWLAVFLFGVWAFGQVENAVCLAINAHANLLYISGANSSPPPFPGPNITNERDSVMHQPYEFSWEEIAASAYRAYAASTGNKNFRGDPMPDWAELPQPIRTAWEAAIRQAASLRNDGIKPGTEQRWNGWLPPHLKGAK